MGQRKDVPSGTPLPNDDFYYFVNAFYSMGFFIQFLMGLGSFVLGSYGVYNLLYDAIDIKNSMPNPEAGTGPFITSLLWFFLIPMIAFIVSMLLLKRLGKVGRGIVVVLIMIVGLFALLSGLASIKLIPGL
jgi:hypothetical protein